MTDDLDERYRRESQSDPSRPSERVQRAVLDHATRLADGHRHQSIWSRLRQRRAPSTPWWPTAFVGTMAITALAGLLILPRLTIFTQGEQPSVAPSAALRVPAAPSEFAPPLPPPVPAMAPGVERLVRQSPASQAPFSADKAVSPTSQRAQTAAAATAQSKSRNMAEMASAAAKANLQSNGIDDSEALRVAAEHGDAQKLRAALAEGININARDARGRTALLRATLAGNAQSVNTLLAHGANPYIADAFGMTALQAALTLHRDDIAEALRNAGARAAPP